jgi:DNA-binding NarL/FixJ family response regulator
MQGRLAARCDARLVAAYAAHTAALAADDGAALLAVADELAAIGARRYALEAAVGAAEAHLRAERADEARRAASRARDLHEPGHGTPPPEIAGLDAVAVALTARESQLIALASEGLSNAEIADRLVLSIRTVESHIYRAMQKLGVSDRREL